MIPPQELKKQKPSARSAKGYDIAQMDDYINFLNEKYAEAYLQCDAYDKKLKIVANRISDIQNEEELIRKLSINTQRNCDRLLAEAEEEAKKKIEESRGIAERIIAEAVNKARSALDSVERKAEAHIESSKERADALLMSARGRCTKLLSDFKKEIAAQTGNIMKIKAVSDEFNSKLLLMYKNHLGLINENTYTPAIDLEGLTESKLFDAVMQEIKNDAAEIARKTSNINIEYDFEKELEILKDSRNAVDRLGAISSGVNNGTGAGSSNLNSNSSSSSGVDGDEDVKVFSKNSAGPAGYASGGAVNISKDNPSDGIYAEKPLATYDSDDYEYKGGEKYGGGSDSGSESGGSSYSDEVYGIDGEESADDYGGDDIYEDEDRNSKGFLGLFKNKKKKKRGDSGRYDSGEDIPDDDTDIFEDLDDDGTDDFGG
ncbi:MAG: DivIVA domain-containing protein [Oscillospiraceae bacterium]|nr:DivIVA domain-containing protein [Oscillospiraceae bacterium]